MYHSKVVIFGWIAICLSASVSSNTDADVERVLQLIQLKLAGVERDLATLEQLKNTKPAGDKSAHPPERPQLLPAEQQREHNLHKPNPAHNEETIAKRGHSDGGHSSSTYQEGNQMTDFKNSLTPEQLQSLKNHYSKTGLIEAILNQRPVPTLYKRRHSDKNQPDPELQDYYKNLTPEEQELLKKFPSQTPHLVQAIEDSKNPVPEEDAEAEVRKRRELNTGTDWSKIMQDMFTHINALKDVIKRATTHHDKGSTATDALASKILDDIELAKNSGVRLEDLLANIYKQGSSKDSRK